MRNKNRFNALNKETGEIFSVKQIDYEKELINNEFAFNKIQILPIYNNLQENREDIYAGQIFQIEIVDDLLSNMKKHVTEKGFKIVKKDVIKNMFCIIRYYYPCMAGEGFRFEFYSDKLSEEGFNIPIFDLDTYGAYLCRNFGKPISHVSNVKQIDQHTCKIEVGEVKLLFFGEKVDQRSIN